VIERGRVVIAKPWSAKQIEKERQRDAAAKRTYFSVLGNRKD
jgi:hypothetical protein